MCQSLRAQRSNPLTAALRHCEGGTTEANQEKTYIMEKKGYIYILFNKRNGTLYTGVTSNLKQRVYEHKSKVHEDSFTAKYGVDKLGYYEEFVLIKDAIAREKQIKAGSRAKKLQLIESINPDWVDLYDTLF